ncbi:unnamed protein product [Psylliodes chrysocephalus]|uniref:Uncharacterized protein n=1 Tax=Psylliodes chrysocephalus TaxID=3402493 RepID=A0A9P0DB34_9CUCU|nr:unnamed protein product [Psylliodes chrysocephala]
MSFLFIRFFTKLNMEENKEYEAHRSPQKKKIKRYCAFSLEWEDMFEHVKKVDSEHGKCILCNVNLIVKLEGKRAIENHCNSQKHKNNVRGLQSSKLLSTFFVTKFLRKKMSFLLLKW